MAWNRRDDKLNSHPKMLALGAPEPRSLWDIGGPQASESGCGGVLRGPEVELVGFLAYLRTPAKLRKAKARLVEVRLWHDHETIHECERCTRYMAEFDIPRLQAGDVIYHDWRDCNPPPARPGDDDSQKTFAKFKEDRRRRLKALPDLRERVRQRDRGLCRYCGVETSASQFDRKSKTARTIDHVDPDGDNTLENLVLACRQCNGIKRDRTPEGAGMTLLQPGQIKDKIKANQGQNQGQNRPS